MRPVVRALALAVILATLAAGAWLASRGTAPERRNLDAVVTLAGDAIRDGTQPAFDLTRMSDAEEARLGDAIHAEARAAMPIGTNPEMQSYLDAIVDRLALGVERRAIPYHIAINPSTEVNAFAAAGGRIYITEGMLGFVETEAELAAVLGHEIGHVDRRHCVRRLQVEQAAGRVMPGLEGLARMGYALMERGFSEEHELEADVTGALLAAEASYDPWEAVTLFEKFLANEPGADRRPTRNPVTGAVLIIPEALGRYFATHPPADQRIEAVRRALGERPAIWRGRRLYVGRGNLKDRRSAATDPREDEWIARTAPPEGEGSAAGAD